MLGKILPIALPALLVISALASSFYIQPVMAVGSIYIRADGSIDPPTAPIQRNGNLYTLTGNIASDTDGIFVERDNIVVDGSGFAVEGAGGYAPDGNYSMGIYLYGRSNVTIRNTTVKNFWHGIVLDSSSNNNIGGNTLTNNGYGGIWLHVSSNHNNINGNTFTDDGLNVWGSYSNTVENNTVNGRPLVYLEGVADFSVGDAGQVVLVRCDRIRVEDLTLSRTSTCVQLWETNNSTIHGNNIGDSWYGIWLEFSSSNNISANTITNNGYHRAGALAGYYDHGIYFGSSSNNSISGNTMTNNGCYGIELHDSSNYDSIVGNRITNNGYDGILLASSSSNSISANTITNNNGDGVHLDSSSNNNISGNTITNNGYDGILLGSSSGNSVIGNNLTANILDGIDLDIFSNSNDVSWNTATANNASGIEFDCSSSNTVTGNTATDNGFSGIFLGNTSSYNIIRGNNATANSQGIVLDVFSDNNVVSGNTATANTYCGIVLHSSSDNNAVIGNTATANSYGVYLNTSSYNTVSGNTVTANTAYGIWFNCSSNYNSMSGNNITANSVDGIVLDSSSDNTIYHNDFINNTGQVYSSNSTNFWDNGYPSGGSYWSDYAGLDVKSGPNQDQPGSDGIGDTPYVIDSNNTDRYPLTYPHALTLTYEVTITAHCTTEGADVNVDIAMDETSTGLGTPHTFTGLNGTRIFAVPAADAEGHPFSHWSTGQTSTTLTVSDGGNYTAYYSVPAPSGNVTRVPQDYHSVQAAVDAASPGSTILISPGVYNESIIVNKPLTIIGKLGSEPIFRGGGSGIAITLLQGASGSIISDIIITSWDEGILVNGASGCRIYDNIMSLTTICGITVQGNNAQSNFVTSNVFENDTVAIDLTSASYNNTVYRNVITANGLGILLGPGRNLVYANTIIGNGIALNLTGPGNNVVFHNNFLNNTVKAAISTSAGNTWDNGYPSGGNYWSDHTQPDLLSGTNQDQPGPDGIVDTPYTVAGGGVDRYPLAQPFNEHDIGITDFAVMKTVVGKGYAVWMEVKVLNYGVHDENFALTVYANMSTAVTESVSLANCSYAIIRLEWNTTSFAFGNYSMSVCAGAVAGETNTADDNFTDGCVMVSLVGDIMGGINGVCDGRVDMKDIGYVARCFGADPTQKLWNPNADINGDGRIDMKDIGIVARHFGEHNP